MVHTLVGFKDAFNTIRLYMVCIEIKTLIWTQQGAGFSMERVIIST